MSQVPKTLSDEAVEAAARAIYDELTPECVDDDGAYALSRVAVAAAVPFVEARVRQQLSDELSEKFLAERDTQPLRGRRRVNSHYDDGYRMGMEDAARAARVVRGDQTNQGEK